MRNGFTRLKAGALVCIFIGAFANRATAQRLSFNHLTSENGLSNNSVLSIAQDGKGFMWLGTSNGLNRYDGWQIKSYMANSQGSSGLQTADILSLLCDTEKELWVGTGTGLNRYNEKADRFEKINLPLQKVAVNALFQDRNRQLWVGTTRGLFLRFNAEKNRFTQFKTASGSSVVKGAVNCILEDRKMNIWIGSDSGLVRLFNNNGRYIFEYFVHDSLKTNTLSGNAVSSLYEDSAGNIWIGTLNEGLNEYDPVSRTFTHFSKQNGRGNGLIHNNIRSLLPKSPDELWVGTQEGLSILDLKTKKFSSFQNDGNDPKSLSQNSIYSLFKDANGSIWVGTYFGGVNRVDAFSTPFNVLRNDGKGNTLNNNVVSSIVEDKNANLWVGTEGGGLNFFDRRNNRFTEYKNDIANPASIASNLVKFVYLDADENVWCGTHGGGLNVLDRQSGVFKHYLYTPNQVRSARLEVTAMTADNSGRFWVISTSGIYLFQKNGTRLTPLELKNGLEPLKQIQANALYKDPDGTVWIGGTPGLYKVTGNTVTVIDTTINVNSILPDGSGNIWLAQRNGPTTIYNIRSKQFYDYKNILGLRNIAGLLKDRFGQLWLSTDGGLIRFDPVRKSFTTYTTADGLAGKEFNYNSFLADSKGEFFFGGYHGITHFFPEQVVINNYRSPLVFTGLLLNNNEVRINEKNGLLKNNIDETDAITFKHDQNLFSINFALLNYIKSNKNKYLIKLSGFDNNWKQVHTPSATYTNLPPGEYVFEVKGANNDDVWTRPIAMKITVLPPFWRSNLAYLIYLLALSGILFLILRFFFMRALLKKEDELHQVKLNFFTNVSHEIRTHLTLIMAPIEKLLHINKEQSFTSQQLTQIKNNSDRLLSLVSELMDFRKAEANHLTLQVEETELIGFLQQIYVSFSELSLAKKISISYTHNIKEAWLFVDKKQLEKVFFNLLTNAFKFTPEGGRIALKVNHQQQATEITVADSGIGIAPEYLPKLFTNYFQVQDHGLQNTGYGLGLSIAKKIVELHHGKLQVETAPQKKEGTSFTVTLLPGTGHFATDGQVHIVPPAAKNEKEIARQPLLREPMPAISGRPQRQQQYTLLIAEDNPELQRLLKQNLELYYNILLAADGAEALELVTELIPDLVISDVMMPRMNGDILCAKIKKDERTSHIPVILLTAKSTQSDQIGGLEMGADAYITKPFSTQVLELTIQNLLEAQRRLQQRLRKEFTLHLAAATTSDVKDAAATTESDFLNHVIGIITAHLEDPDFGVEKLSRKVAMSTPVLYKKLRALTNMSVNELIKNIRFKKAAE
ncbi:MAG: response regulator, partial [Niabella sp.]|nr:response regulator [Niabella sp.]